MSKDQWHDYWIQGYACAVATMQRMDGDLLTTQVKELLEAGGLTKETCLSACVDPYDMEVLFKENVYE